MLNYQFFRSRPTYMYRLDPSRIFGNTFTSRKTTNTARLGLCVMSAQAGLLPLLVQLQLCGDMYNAFTPLRSPTGLSNHAELSINFPQTSDLYIPLRSKSDIFGNTLNSRKTTKTTRGGLCATSVQTSPLPLAVQLHLCGTICDACTPLIIPQVPSNHAELSSIFRRLF